MYKIVALALCLTTSSTFVFAEDHTPPAVEWAGVNEIEAYLEKNPDQSADEVLAQFPEVSKTLHLDGAHAISASLESELPLGIPAFFWGCCFGLLGVILVVLVTDNDKTQTRKSIYGCLAGTGIVVGLYLILLISGAAWVSFS